MKMDLRRGPGGEPDETLRSRLREWSVPVAPPGIEAELLRAFRQRRRQRRLAPWLALAAVLAGVAVWPLLRKDARPSDAAGTPAVTARKPQPRSAVVPSEPAAPASTPAVRVALDSTGARRHTGRLRKAPAVIVEPGQAELLVRLGETLQDLRPPTTVLSGAEVAVVPARAPETPTLAAVGVPRYQAAWETVAGVWPLVQLSASSMGR
jgi:hypothetical protein